MQHPFLCADCSFGGLPEGVLPAKGKGKWSRSHIDPASLLPRWQHEHWLGHLRVCRENQTGSTRSNEAAEVCSEAFLPRVCHKVLCGPQSCACNRCACLSISRVWKHRFYVALDLLQPFGSQICRFLQFCFEGKCL